MDIKEAVSDIKTAFTQESESLRQLVEQRDGEIKELGQAREETGQAIKEANDRLEQIANDLKGTQEKLGDLEKRSGRLLDGGMDSPQSLGELFTESDAYKNYNAQSDNRSGSLQVKSLFSRKTLTNESIGDTPAYLYTPQRLAEIIRDPDRMERVRDLLTVTPTGLSAIEYVEETNFTNEAGTVPEFDADYDGEKPRSAISFEPKTESVKTIAHWLPITRAMSADVPTIQGYINARLITGLKLVEDAQLLKGDGTGTNLQGIMTHDNVQSYAWSDGPVDTDTKVDAVRRAMTRARLAEYPVTGVVLHPSDWEDIELLKGNDDHYIWTTVTEGGQSRLWRVSVVDTTALDEGEFLVGAFALGAQLWDREQANIRISDSHSDFFTKNLLAILAEERLIFTIYRPEAFVVGDFDEAPTGAS